ncbi:MAG: ABC-F family ATP-binding cassette domain-containing protein [Planctomycetes bacterium]|nr:ABC-F family ATP-binding cassette domain-containing protein [Planctomycetota bacterium]
MALIAVNKIGKHYGGPLLFKDITLEVERGLKAGILGQNGTGKSTLLRIMAGELEATDGQVFRQRDAVIAYQAQELRYEPDATVMDEMRRVYAGDYDRARKIAALEETLAVDQAEDARRRTLAEYERLTHEHDTRSGYDLDRKIESVLSGLGLPESAWEQRIESFSGGERNIVGLARILLLNPDVMLLDEPSNHLDMDGIEWFIQFVRNTSAAVVMVSHNRHLLDAYAQEIWELRSTKLTRWAGNYSDFVRQKEEALALQEREYKSQQRLIKQLEFQARRLKDMAKAYNDPGQAKRAKAMEMRVEQMEKVDRPDRGEDRFRASFGSGKHRGHIAMSVKDFSFAYGESGVRSPASGVESPNSQDSGPGTQDRHRVIFEKACLEIEHGERVCLVGPNGSGKTTLFNEILKKADWDNPTLRLGKGVKLGSYSQLHDVLDHDASLIDWACAATGLLFQPASELLHRFMFDRDDLKRPVSTLSGGEKSRLQLARLVHAKVNFLMLDEPTNHLDIQACEQLEEMLDEFDGTLLVISHDRYFLDKLVNRVVEVRDRRLQSFDGSFAAWYTERYSDREARRKTALQLHSQREAATVRGAAAQEREEKKARQRELHRLRTQLRSLEEKIAKLESRQAELSAQLETAFSGASDALHARELSRDFEALGVEIKGLYAQWEELAAQVE